MTSYGSILICLVAFGAMCVASWIGLRSARRTPRSGDASMIVNALFALLGLLVAFTFSAAFARLDTRRTLIAEEANDIGTFYLRLDLLPPSARDPLRTQVRAYTETRAALLVDQTDRAQGAANRRRTGEQQQQIWSATAVASVAAAGNVSLLLLNPLNAMIDITTTRRVASEIHSPLIVFVTLFGLAILSVGLSAYSGHEALHWMHLVAFSAVMAFTLYVILDVEFPRQGLINLAGTNHVLFDLAATMR